MSSDTTTADPPIPQVTAVPVRIIQLPELEKSSRLLYPNHKTVTQCMICGFASVDPWEFVGHSCSS